MKTYALAIIFALAGCVSPQEVRNRPTPNQQFTFTTNRPYDKVAACIDNAWNRHYPGAWTMTIDEDAQTSYIEAVSQDPYWIVVHQTRVHQQSPTEVHIEERYPATFGTEMPAWISAALTTCTASK